MLDAVHNKNQPQKSIVPYDKAGVKKYLRVVTSFFRGTEGKAEAVCMIFSDLSELIELRDSMKTMDEISRLNRKLTVRNDLYTFRPVDFYQTAFQHISVIF